MDSTAKFMWLQLPKTRQAVPEGSDGAAEHTELSSLELLNPGSVPFLLQEEAGSRDARVSIA